MTIRLQILQNQPEHIWNQWITKTVLLSLHPSQVLKRDIGKGGQIQSWLVKARKGARLKTWQWQVLATVFFLVRKADMEGSWFFFTPLGNVIFHTALAVFKWWQTGHNKVWHMESVTQIIFFFSWRICQRQCECMIAAAAERPICHSVCITAQRLWNCPEVAIWWPLAKTQSLLLKGNTSKNDSVNLLLWHACTEKAPDYP